MSDKQESCEECGGTERYYGNYCCECQKNLCDWCLGYGGMCTDCGDELEEEE